MALVYHLMPRSFVGSTLYPLNQLRHLFPDIYEQHCRKYQGREEITKRQIPILDCLWNDVLFFAPLHPGTIHAALLEIGNPWRPRKWLEIDTDACGFNAQNTVIYESDMTREKGDFTLSPDQVMPFVSEKLTFLEAIPSATLKHYREAAKRGENIMLWRGVTHVLHKGEIALDEARLFEL